MSLERKIKREYDIKDPKTHHNLSKLYMISNIS